MYLRLYPTKNNTIFQANGGSQIARNGLINTGANPIMQLMEGNYQGEVVLQFVIPEDLFDKINQFDTTIKLKMWDASYVPGFSQMGPKTYSLSKNTDEFQEGSGYFFIGNDAIAGTSNFQYRDDLNTAWSPKTLVDTIVTDRWHDDLEFTIDSLNQGINTFFIKPTNPSTDVTIQNAKYVYSRHTRTIYLPYLEITIADTVKDSKKNYLGGKLNKGYLINQQGLDFTGEITCQLLDNQKVLIKDVDVINQGDGIYYYEDSIDLSYSGSYIYETWYLEGDKLWEELVNVISPNQVKTTGLIYEGHYFYPTSTYPHEIIMWGDKLNMQVIANARGGANITRDYFEYRVMCDNGFEMIPWQKVNTYRGDMWFNFDTSFFFPDINYEVQVRMNVNGVIFTSELVYKFKLAYNKSSQFVSEFNASPYQSRDYQLQKALKR